MQTQRDRGSWDCRARVWPSGRNHEPWGDGCNQHSLNVTYLPWTGKDIIRIKLLSPGPPGSSICQWVPSAYLAFCSESKTQILRTYSSFYSPDSRTHSVLGPNIFGEPHAHAWFTWIWCWSLHVLWVTFQNYLNQMNSYFPISPHIVWLTTTLLPYFFF